MEDLEPLNHRLCGEYDRLNAERFNGQAGGYAVHFSRTACRTHGCINFRRKRIMVSYPMYEQHGWEAVVQTLLHEMTHALLHQEGAHDRHTKRFYSELLSRGGSKRKYDVKPKSAYIYACPTCGRETARLKRIRSPSRYSCSKCDKRFNPQHRLYLKRDKC